MIFSGSANAWRACCSGASMSSASHSLRDLGGFAMPAFAIADLPLATLANAGSPRHSVAMRGIALSLVLLAAACSPQTPRGAPIANGEETPVKQRLMVWDDLLSRPKVSPQQTIRWGQGPTDIVDVWLPEGAGPHPVVLMAHGGCWQKSVADRTLMNWAAEDLRKQGIAV